MQEQMQRGDLLTIVIVAGLCLGAGVVSATEAPLAEAGLDQQVQQGAMVYLDAGGSVDPDDNIEQYRWQITAPNGTALKPACPSCVQTQFQTDQSGEYEVTVTVTDDTGMSRSDTLVVTVNASEPPSVTLSGPSSATTTGTYSYQASVSAGDSPLSQLEWKQNESLVRTEVIGGNEAVQSRNFSFDTRGTKTLAVTVGDAAGQTDRTESVARVRNQSNPDSIANDSDPGSNKSDVRTNPSASSGAASSTSTGGTGFYEEITRSSRNHGPGYNYYFNFVNDDQLASNKHGGNSGLGADAGGQGVRKYTLQELVSKNPDVTVTDESYAETTFRVSGQVAENFESNPDVHIPGTRIGTTDIITKDELTSSPTDSDSGDSGSSSVDNANSGDGSTGTSTNSGKSSDTTGVTSNGADTSNDGSSSDSRLDDDGTSNTVSDGSSSDDSSSPASYDSDSNTVTDSSGDCVGWGCSDVDLGTNQTTSSDSSGSTSDTGSGGLGNTDSTDSSSDNGCTGMVIGGTCVPA